MSEGPGSRWAVIGLTLRLIRRGALILAVVGAAYIALEAVSYLQSYPDAASRARLASLQDNPSVRMLQGAAHNIDTTGGFIAWDAGWFLETVAAIWVLLAVVRITRADEENDRGTLVLLVPLRAEQVLRWQLSSVCAAALPLGAACGAALVAFGVPPGGAALFSLGLVGFVATVAGLAGLASELFDVRRRAMGAAAALLAGAFLVRMVGNSAESWAWSRWLTPYGWMDNLQPYGEVRWPALALLLLAPLCLTAACALLRSRRDLGGALVTSSDTKPPRTALLHSPVAFAFRCGKGVVLAWALGLAAYAALIGSLLPAMVDYFVGEPSLRKALETYGIDAMNIEQGMVSFMSTVFGLALALYGCWRIGAARTEESTGRADLLLVRPLSRRRWLADHVLLAGSTIVVLALTTGLSMWAGGRLAGAELSVRDTLAASLNGLPAVLLLTALAVVVLGVWPRVTVPLSAGAAGVAYLLPVLGRGLSLPTWLRDLSPFQHLAAVPLEPYALRSGLVMLVMAAGVAALGVAAFTRRDLTSG